MEWAKRKVAAHCCLLDPTKPYQKLPLHLLEPSLIFLSLLLKDWRWLASKCVTEVKCVCGPRPLYTLVNGQAY